MVVAPEVGDGRPGGEWRCHRVVPPPSGTHNARVGPDERPSPARTPGVSTSIVGRAPEQVEIARLLSAVRQGLSGALVLRGEAGIGKTALLDDAAASAGDLDVVRLVGIESEIELGFAALHQLLRPLLSEVDRLPPPQAGALRAAFGFGDGGPPDLFMVGLATLTLLAGMSTERGLLVLVDDAQWLDQESATVLGFVARRLYADRIAVLAALREVTTGGHAFDALPSVALQGLPDDLARDLIASSARSPMSAHVRPCGSSSRPPAIRSR